MLTILMFVSSAKRWLKFTYLRHQHIRDLILQEVLNTAMQEVHVWVVKTVAPHLPLYSALWRSHEASVWDLTASDDTDWCHVRPVLNQLHWLPVEYCNIKYKLCLLIHLVHINKVPQYLTDIVTTVVESSARPSLRSADTAACTKPCKRTRCGERCFCFTGAITWAACLHICTP